MSTDAPSPDLRSPDPDTPDPDSLPVDPADVVQEPMGSEVPTDVERPVTGDPDADQDDLTNTEG
jgi:hypothetical protein